MSWTKVFNHLLGDYKVETEEQSDGALRQVVKLGGGALVPETYDYMALSYVAAGNGAGEIETITYKTGGASGTTVATLTLAYDGSDNIFTITKA